MEGMYGLVKHTASRDTVFLHQYPQSNARAPLRLYPQALARFYPYHLRQLSNYRIPAYDYDLIVLDVNLPDGNGFDFCAEIKERRPFSYQDDDTGIL